MRTLLEILERFCQLLGRQIPIIQEISTQSYRRFSAQKSKTKYTPSTSSPKLTFFRLLHMMLSVEHLNHLKNVVWSLWSRIKNTTTTTPLTPDSDESDEDTEGYYPGILDSELTSLTKAQRGVFITTLSVLFVLSVCGNIGTLHVNMRRKMRPFFRACLISLAFSDLWNTLFLTSAYLSQFTAEYVQIWRLGSVMCGLVPFATTAAILASSMTIVGIALDRYFAVMKAVIGCWNPGVFSCLCGMFVIWAAALGIASPVFHIYSVLPVYILHMEDFDNPAARSQIWSATIGSTPSAGAAKGNPLWEIKTSQSNNSYTLVQEEQLVSMCVSQQKDVALYYFIVFGIIFIPSIIAFIWLNTIIATELWKRRQPNTAAKQPGRSNTRSASNFIELPGASSSRNPKGLCTISSITTTQRPQCNCSSTHFTTITMPSSAAANTPSYVTSSAYSNSQKSQSRRESRHIRLFTFIILMMAVFLFFRLPAWIFLIVRMYGSYSQPVHWILYFSFGILHITSCVLNPLFYTFHTEAIQCAMFVKTKLCVDICGLRDCCVRRQRRKSKVLFPGQHNYGGCQSVGGARPIENGSHSDHNCCGLLCGAQQFYRPQQQMQQSQLQLTVLKQQPKPINCDKDEGVECSDASEQGDGASYVYDFNQHTYTIFPLSFTPSTISSH